MPLKLNAFSIAVADFIFVLESKCAYLSVVLELECPSQSCISFKNEIIQISKQITPITEEIRHCKNILQRVDKIKQFQLHEQIEQEKSQFEKEQEKNKMEKLLMTLLKEKA